MKKNVFFVSLLVMMTILGACGKEDVPDKPTGNATEKSIESSSDYEIFASESSTVQVGSDKVAREEYSSDWSEDWRGLITKINKVVIVELSDDYVESEGLTSKYVTQVYFSLENSSEEDFNTFPDQSTLVIAGQQIDSAFNSDDIGGEIMGGVTKEGIITYEIEKPINVSDVKEIRIKWSAHKESETYEAEDYKEYDVRLDLSH